MLFWEKYRPTTKEELILPERIRKLANEGIQGNYLFHGHQGCGKTTLARILVEDHPNIILSSKLGVEELRTTIDRFCRGMIPFEDPTKLRVVYFEEFDKATSLLQEELKSFIEEHSKVVRFIATCNNINKINPAVRSRFIEVDYSPIGAESKEVMNGFAKRVYDICQRDNINITKEILKESIELRFPDLRKVWQDVQVYHITQNSPSKKTGDFDPKLFDYATSSAYNSGETWDYLYANWMDKIDEGFYKMGREFVKWVRERKPEKLDVLGTYGITLTEYTDLRLPNALDPFLTLFALISKTQSLFK